MIYPDDRDALRFHFLENKPPLQFCTLTRALFGLGGVTKHHLNTAQSEQPKKVEEIERGFNMDDIIPGGQTVE